MSKARIIADYAGTGAATDLATQTELNAVSTVASAALPKAGGDMTGNIVMGDDTSIGIADDAERIEFDGAGDISVMGANLGVGTATPDRMMEIEGSEAAIHLDSSANSFILIDRGATSNVGQIGFQTAGSSSWYAGMADSDVSGFDGSEFFIGEASGGASDAHFVIDNSGYVSMAGASDVRLTLGSTGTAGTNDASWIRGTGADMMYNAASGNHVWEIGGSEKLRVLVGTETGYCKEHLRIAGPMSMGTSSMACRYLWGPGYVSTNETYLHLRTNLWGGGSPHGNTEYIMGGFIVQGYDYASGSGNINWQGMFHNWSGGLSNYNSTDFGNATGRCHAYIDSNGMIALRLNKGTYSSYSVHFEQYPIYGRREVFITHSTYSSSATL